MWPKMRWHWRTPSTHLVVQAQMRREQLAVPQMTGMPKLLRVASQVAPQRRPLLGAQRGGPTRTRPVTQAGQSLGFKARHPALHRSSIFPKHVGDLLAAVAAGDQQQPVQPMVVPRLIGPSEFLLDGQSHDVGISNDQFSHDRPSTLGIGHQDNSIMRQYICRYVYLHSFSKGVAKVALYYSHRTSTVDLLN
jgi:hypothetical protein